VRTKAITIAMICAALVCVLDRAAAQTQARAANGAAVKQPSPPASFDCSADGTVVNAVTHEPIARARVNLNVPGTDGYSTTTDSGGRWTLTGVGCGSAQVQVTRPGFLVSGVAGRALMRPIRLASGSPAHDLRTELLPQALVTGKVLDDQGDPVQGAQVHAIAARVVDGRAHFQQAGASASNDIGEYRLANLQPGKYIFCVHLNSRPAEARERTMPADSCYPGPLEGGSASAMDLAAGREAKVDFNVNQVAAVHIRGTVSGGPEGRGVGVSLLEVIPNADINRPITGSVRDGKFDFRVAPGSYMLSADYFEQGKRLSARVPVTAGTSDIDDVAVRLDQGFTVTGVIRVASQSSAAPPQFNISLHPAESAIGMGQLKWGADKTTFSFSDMMPGSFRLDANPPSPFYIKSATLAGQDIFENFLPISQSAGPIEITLRDDGGSVEGDIADSAGQAIAGGVLLLRGTIRIAAGFAGDNGHFKLDHLPPGDYTASAWNDVSQVQYAETEWMRRYGSGGVPVSVAAGQNVQIKLTEQTAPTQ
jgi:hypothetical protein